jgi:hypothetical protein
LVGLGNQIVSERRHIRMTSTNSSRFGHPRRSARTSGFIAVSASLALLLAACGDAEQAAVSTVAAAAPPVIQVVPGGGSASGAAPNSEGAAADGAVASSDQAMTRMAWMEYVLGVDLEELDGDSPAWRLVAGDVDPARITALAAALGLEGEVTDLPADWGAGWIIGPSDGTAPSLTVSRDGMLSWWYSSGPGEAFVGCAMPAEPLPAEPLPTEEVVEPTEGAAGTADTAIADTVIECVEPAPPVGVPTEAEAEARMVELLGQWGVDVNQVVIETYADEWGANVTASLLLEGQRTPLSWGVSFGGGGQVLYANGVLADTERVADYPRIGTTAAFERLQQGGYWWGGGVGFADSAVVRSDETPAPDENLVGGDAVAETPPSEGATDETMVEPGDTGEVAIDEIPIDQGEPLIVTITGVEEELWMLWDADGTVWLVPGYVFTSDDGGRNSVPAIADEFLDIQEPVPGPEILPVPLPDTGTGGSTGGSTDPVVEELTDLPIEGGIEALVGMTEADAIAVIEEQGWTSRISARDGEYFALTMDFRSDRVNLEIVDGVVTVATIG